MVSCVKKYTSRIFSDNYTRNDKIQYITLNNNNAHNPGINGNYKMARRKRGFHILAGVLLGIILAHILRIYLQSLPIDSKPLKCMSGNRRLEAKASESAETDPFKIIRFVDEQQTIHNSKKSLLFVGVMTADKYLKNRATAVYRTWGKELPGSLAFFSSSYSRSNVLPLVALKGVDDSYPPQKKSFMMLLYMHDNFIDKFEWFLRADDDVFIKADKLETLLRSVDSRRAQFIGQAGRGNSEEFGSLSLEYDENFCMGGPGVIMSRETLKRIAPHIKECLKNLYTTHEDVELGRCVQKFAGVPCTWSYEMQSILYHNSSGSLAYTGNLKKREVHQAITMHPVKDHHHMYRIHAYLKNLRIQELKETIIALHRDILIAAKEMKMEANELAMFNVAEDVPLFPNLQGHSGYLGDTNILGVAPNLNRYHPNKLKNVLSWDFISKAVFSPDNSNPKRRMEFSMKEALDDIIRELMENINAFSKQRGRVIEFREILYGYQRLDPIHGADYILDILLVYKKYRGRKMTVPVRRHAYLQQSFTGLEIHEGTLGDSHSLKSATKDENSEQVDYDTDNLYPGGESGASTQSSQFINFKKLNVPIRQAFETGMLKISEKLPSVFKSASGKPDSGSLVQIINFILPLSGRFDIFVRFMKNYEEICLISDKRTSLIITLYNDINNPSDFNKTLNLINLFSNKYSYTKIVPIKITDSQFSRALALEKGVGVCNQDELLFLIDVDILFNAESLQRIRLNTVRHRQAYFPIVFSEYDPGVVNGEEYNVIKIRNKLVNRGESDSGDVIGDHVHMKAQSDNGDKYYTKPEMLSDDRGYFRQFGFGIASVYKSDFVIVGGFNTDIKGWGLEDVHLYDKFVQSNVSIFRSVDTGLVHVFHPVDCDKNLELAQFNMCVGTRANTFGSIKHMILYLFNHPTIVPPIQPDPVNDKPRIMP